MRSALRIVLASRNPHKLRELAGVLAPHTLEPLPESVELPPEDGETFADNALIKARAAAAATGAPALADDSGIVVAALGGAPGVRPRATPARPRPTRRTSPSCIDDMEGEEDRRAAYVCVLALVRARTGRSACSRAAARAGWPDAPRGTGGFGYDPVFVPDDLDGHERTMAEIAPAEKDAISHRGRAARALGAALGEAP